MPPPITAQVATVRQSTSVPAKFQIASRQATTATRMQALVVQKEILVTMRGLRKPLFILPVVESTATGCGSLLRTHRNNYEIGADCAEFSHSRDA